MLQTTERISRAGMVKKYQQQKFIKAWKHLKFGQFRYHENDYTTPLNSSRSTCHTYRFKH